MHGLCNYTIFDLRQDHHTDRSMYVVVLKKHIVSLTYEGNGQLSCGLVVNLWEFSITCLGSIFNIQ